MEVEIFICKSVEGKCTGAKRNIKREKGFL